MYLADAANEKRDFMCWPKQDVIAEAVRLSVRTVSSALAYLEEQGFIVREKRRRQAGPKKGYRTSDEIFVQVDESIQIDPEPYGEWLRTRRSHMNGVPVSHEPDDNSYLNQLQSNEPKEEPQVEPSGTQATSTDTSSSARDARDEMQVLVDVTLEAIKMIPNLQDEDLAAQYEKILMTPTLPFQDVPGMQEANLLFVAACETEFSKRFGSGGVS